jgi:hypothetical protein
MCCVLGVHAAGLPEADYVYLEQLLTAMKEGKPAPSRQEAAKAAAAAAPAAAVGGMYGVIATRRDYSSRCTHLAGVCFGMSHGVGEDGACTGQVCVHDVTRGVTCRCGVSLPC